MTKNNSAGTELAMRRVEPGEVMDAPGGVTRAGSWIGWHFYELTGVLVPAAVAVAVSPWAWVVSGAVGAGWTVHSARTTRTQAAIRAAGDLPPVTVEADTASESGVDATGVGSVSKPAGVWL